jgi:hypothetical protein
VERVTVPGLGDVEVRGLRLSAIMPLMQGGLVGGDTRLVAAAVVADDGLPLWTPEEWDVWAGAHIAAWTELGRVVARVCGLDLEASEGN